MIKINKVFSYSDIGQRSNNEDTYSYSESNFFLVCDGVGGAEKGEVASSIVANEFSSAFTNNSNSKPEYVLRSAEKKMSEHLQDNPDSIGMATTLTFSQLTESGILVGWVGDSRVYQFRKGKIQFQTTDHSWVNDALRVGIITKEEAINHPKSNIITRAIQGEYKPVDIDLELITDLRNGDFIFHCSDGVLESWSNEELESLFSSVSDGGEILHIIENKCTEFSKDNNTAILYQIYSDVNYVDDSTLKNEEIVDGIPIDSNDVKEFLNSEVELHQTYTVGNIKSKFKFNKWLFFSAFVIIISSIYFSLSTSNDKSSQVKVDKEVRGQARINKHPIKKKLNVRFIKDEPKNLKNEVKDSMKRVETDSSKIIDDNIQKTSDLSKEQNQIIVKTAAKKIFKSRVQD